MDLQKLGAKVFLERGADVPLEEVVPVFHSWIREHSIEGTLIDVADYRHVRNGPGVLLVGYESHLALDDGDGRRGLALDWKRPLEGSALERLRVVVRQLLRAASRLEEETSLGGRLRFRSDELLIRASDRALVPNDDATWAAFQPDLEALLARLHPGVACNVTRETDPRRRFSVTVRAPQAASLRTLLDRLGDA